MAWASPVVFSFNLIGKHSVSCSRICLPAVPAGRSRMYGCDE
jgi:hypothetical protein